MILRITSMAIHVPVLVTETIHDLTLALALEAVPELLLLLLNLLRHCEKSFHGLY